MIQDPLTLYKLIVLYMLNRVTFPITRSQISDFILEKEYTNFLTLQQVFSELIDARLIDAQSVRNRTHLMITADGRETLQFFANRINYGIKEDIDTFLKEKSVAMRNEVSILADYSYRSSSGEYEATLTARDKGVTLVSITLSVPTEDTAAAICDNWQKKNQEIYQKLIEQLF